jgi:Uma2 family endonuclease
MSTVPRPAAVPPLRDGERLSRAEFHRRYEAMPDGVKAELIDGVVYMPSPVRVPVHTEPHGNIDLWLGTYRVYTPGVRGGPEGTVRLAPKSEPQPDVLLFIDAARGGQSRIDADQYLAGAPELVAEIAASSVDRDLGAKRRAYRRAGVREYIVWRVEDGELDWFVLRGTAFRRLRRGRDGLYRSEVFPGLWLDAAALLGGNMIRVLQVLQQGLASPEHAAFVVRLQQAGPAAP